MIKAMFLVVTVLGCGVMALPYNRLEGRLNILEQKVFHDARVFREDIATIFQKLANLNESEDNAEKAVTVVEMVNKLDDKTDTRLKRAFHQEKQFVRKYLMDFTSGLMDKLDTRLGELQNEQREIVRLINGTNSLYGSVKDKLENQNIVEKIQNESLLLIKELNFVTRLSHNNSEFCVNMITDLQLSLNKLQSDISSLKADQMNNFLRIENTIKCSKDGGIHFDNSCYYVNKTPLTWGEARQVCTTLGAFLAEVESQSEQDFLVKHVKEKYSGDGTWLGGLDTEEEGTWVWSHSGRLFENVYSSWNVGEPNGGTVENCLHLNKHVNFLWNDVSCSRRMGYVCEKTLII